MRSKNNGGVSLAKALINAGFPDVGITVKCMMHNMQNKHPEHSLRTSQATLLPRTHIDLNYSKLCRECNQIKNAKEFALNRNNKDGLHTRCKNCANTRRLLLGIKNRKLAYSLYNYHGDIEGMSWEHSNNDGYLHRRYLMDKYKLTAPLSSTQFAELMIREHRAGIPNYPGLIIININQNHMNMKESAKGDVI